MLTRSVDAIISATHVLPDHVVIARRAYAGCPATLAALSRLQDALMDVDRAMLGRAAQAPQTDVGHGS